MNPAFASIALAVFSLLSLFLYPCFLPSRSYADTPEVTPSITIGSSGTLAFDVTPGSFAYGRQDITVLTTNYTGYTLTAVPSSNDSRLTNTATATPSYITSIASDSTSSNFSSAEYGFSTDSTITSSTTYHPVTTSTEIKRTNSATTTQESGTFQFTIGAKAGSNTPAGTYTRTFTLTAIANPVAYAVTYVENAGQDTVSNMPSPNPQTTGTVVGTTLTLSSTVPERAGYTFLGWDTNSSATTATYNAGGSYSLDQTTSNQITLYAIWQKAYLQNWSGCSSLAVGDTIEAYDIRDNQVYTISKVYMDANHTAANAKCWIMQNLRLDFSNLQEDISASNTNNPTSEFITQASAHPTSDEDEWEPEYDIQFNTAGLGDTTLDPSTGHTYNDNGVYYNWYTATAGNGKSTTAAEENTSGDLCPSGWRLPTGGANGEFADLNTAVNNGSTTSESGLLSVMDFVHSGYYHNDDAIFKNRGDSGELWSSTKADDDVRAYTVMFKSSTVEPGTHLGTFYGGIPIRCIKQAPTHTLTVSYGAGVSGVTIGGTPVANNSTLQLEEGVFYSINMTFSSGYEFDSWSATSGTLGSASTQSTTYTIGSSDATLTANGKVIVITFDQAYAAAGKTKVNGYYAMQDMNSSICAAVTTDQTGTVIDTRDNQTYRIAKWKMSSDGSSASCWMMDNLNLGAQTLTVTKLDSTNTHLPTNGTEDVSTSTFNGWIRNTVTRSFTSPQLIPITASNSYDGADSDSYGSKYGTIYNFCAATAGTICSSTLYSNASYDLCPSGWRLPTTGSSGEFKKLFADGYGATDSAAGSTIIRSTLKYPFSGVAVHSQNSGRPYQQGAWGGYWGSTRKDAETMIYMFIDASSVKFTDNFYRFNASAIRCIAQ